MTNGIWFTERQRARWTRLALLRYGGILLLVTAGAGPLSADAIPLGFTVAVADLFNVSGQVCNNSGLNSASCSFGGASSNAVVTNGQGGMASVSLGGTATAGSALTGYYIGLQGPASVNVPILINGFASTQDNGAQNGASFAFYYLYQGSSTGHNVLGEYFASPTACSFITKAGFSCMSTGQFTLKTSITSGFPFYVVFEAAAAGKDASALIDPTVTIDPSFAEASEFTLVANPGVFDPAAAIPEPCSLMLLAFGLAGIIVAAKSAREADASI